MSDVDPGERAWYAKPGFIAAAAVLALIVVGGGVALGVNQLRAEPTPSPSPSTSTSSEPSESLEPSGSSPATAEESVCGLTDSEEQSSLDEAPDAEWSFVGTIAAPSSNDGPGVVEDDGFRYCYARTGEGALLAVANYLAVSSEPSLRDRLPELLFDVDEVPSSEDSSGYGDARLTIVGFRLLSYGSDEATIDLAIEVNSADNQLLSMPIRVFWHDGDWRFTLSSFESTPAPLASLGGYVAWSPDGP